jgi:hypothetical protein
MLVGAIKMTSKVLALPVTVEQIANTIKQMSDEERVLLFELVPELTQVDKQRTMVDAQESLRQLEEELRAIWNGQPPALNDPFIGELTLGEYLALPDEQQAKLWDELAGDDWLENIEERDAHRNALPAR